MKIRNGFVSNSSSSSFVVKKAYLSEHQLDMIRNHHEIADDDAWTITETDTTISGSTWMDNFSMFQHMKKIGVYMKYVQWGDTEWFEEDEDYGDED